MATVATPFLITLSPQYHPIFNLVDPLIDRELELLRHIAAGLSNQEIAQELFLAIGTVKKHLNHLTNILDKLGVSDRTQAAVKAKEFGLV